MKYKLKTDVLEAAKLKIKQYSFSYDKVGILDEVIDRYTKEKYLRQHHFFSFLRIYLVGGNEGLSNKEALLNDSLERTIARRLYDKMLPTGISEEVDIAVFVRKIVEYDDTWRNDHGIVGVELEKDLLVLFLETLCDLPDIYDFSFEDILSIYNFIHHRFFLATQDTMGKTDIFSPDMFDNITRWFSETDLEPTRDCLYQLMKKYQHSVISSIQPNRDWEQINRGNLGLSLLSPFPPIQTVSIESGAIERASFPSIQRSSITSGAIQHLSFDGTQLETVSPSYMHIQNNLSNITMEPGHIRISFQLSEDEDLDIDLT